ncbi:hypothetical protein QE152_g4238 [Popillia japonica]|uniref:Uncharacterized protein n=1 Tax=Popillia japonica TaxID=7064 RepID=A0AAW1N381_POPJA
MTQHRFIYYEIKMDRAPQRLMERKIFATNWGTYNANIEPRLNGLTEKERNSYKICTDIMKEAYENSTSEGPRGRKAVPYWWNDEIQMKRKQWTAIRRQGTKIPRNTSEEIRQKAREEYSKKRKERESNGLQSGDRVQKYQGTLARKLGRRQERSIARKERSYGI